MGFIITGRRSGAFIEPVATIGSTAQAAFPQRNLTEWHRPYVQARSTGAPVSGTTHFGLDYGTTRPIAAVALLNVSVASVKIQANATDSWGSPTNDSGALTVPRDRLTQRYNYFYRPGAAWNSATRYLRVVANTTTVNAEDGSGVFAVGALVGLGTAAELVTPLADPIDLEPVEAVLDGITSGGSDDTLAVGETRAEITIAQSLLAATEEAEILDLLSKNGQAGVFCFFRNDGDPSQVYFVRRVGRGKLTITGPNSRRVDAITLRELI